MAEEKNDFGKTLVSWKYPSHIKPTRSRRWYTIAAIIGGLSFAFAVITLNFLFSFILIMIVLIMVLQHRQMPSEITCDITEDGIKMVDDFFKYDDLKEFWIAYKPPDVKKLYLSFKSSLRPMLIIPLEEQNPLKVRKILLDYLDEDLSREDETTTEALSRLLKF